MSAPRKATHSLLYCGVDRNTVAKLLTSSKDLAIQAHKGKLASIQWQIAQIRDLLSDASEPGRH